MSDVSIDDVTPTNCTLAVHDAGNSMSYLVQGNLATRWTWKTMTEESIEDLKRDLNAGPLQEGQIIMVRNMDSGRNLLLFGDTVVKYDGCQVEDVPLEMLADELTKKRKFVFRPNVPWPLVAWAEDDNGKRITVKMQDQIMMFKDPRMGIRDPIRLFLPPLWAYFPLAMDNTPTGMALALVKDEEDSVETTTIYNVPLPNIHEGGGICFGSVTASLGLGNKPSIKEAIAWQFRRWIGSNSNADLLTGDHVVPDDVYNSLPAETRKKFDSLIKSEGRNFRGGAELMKTLAVWSQPMGWARCNYRAMSDSQRRRFLCESR